MPIHNNWMIVLSCLALSACGGSSSGPVSDEQFTLNDDGLIIPDSAEDENLGTPNFAISGFVGTRVYSQSGTFDWIATVSNTGSGPGELPETGLLLESTTSDFSNGSAIAYYSVERTDGEEDRELQPGESVEITGFNTVAGFAKLVGRFSWTDSYVRFWLNPDYGTFTFLNPTEGSGFYESRYLQIEENYDDNMTDIIQVLKERYFPQACFEDPFEENDTIDSAELIALNTEYEIILCEDSFEIFDISLEAGSVYEVVPDGFDFENGRISRLIVIAPDNSYVVDKTGISDLFTAPVTGVYKVVITPPFGEDQGIRIEGSFTIMER